MPGVALVDSCVWIQLLRAGLDPVRELTSRARESDLATCGMVRLEVLRGITNRRVHDAVRAFFDVMQNSPSDNRVWDDAGNVAWQLGRRGMHLPAQDIVIAACAQRIGAAVLTHDNHFLEIPGLTVLTSLDQLT
ncbi:MAG: PIN domain-containing protein [Limisphaerales bacterium]